MLVLDEAASRQISRFIAYSPSQVPLMMQFNNSSFVMVFGCVASNCRIFLPADLKIKSRVHENRKGGHDSTDFELFEASDVMPIQVSGLAHWSRTL